MKDNMKFRNKRGQISVFIILAIVIIAGIVIYFMVRGDLFNPKIPGDFEPIYSYYLDCIDREVLKGANILGQQGGYIQTPEFSPGSDYMPFSSKLGFLGIGIPYWYYISGNGIVKEQIPSKEEMEIQLSDFLKQRISLCDFSKFEEEGFEIHVGEIRAIKSRIEGHLIEVEVKQDLGIWREDISWTKEKHVEETNSELGNFYDLAEKIYKNNKETMFLENYGIDILRMYAPVDGVEIGCSPKIWSAYEVRDDLIESLEVNIPMIKVKGDYYELSAKENEYFVQDIGEKVNVNVNFLYSNQWPMKVEVWPSEDGVLKAEPVGTQEGLGMLGFCYIPYHFVYDFAYPVLIQIYSGEDIFQFPVVVLIEKNHPREAQDIEGQPSVVPELCEHKNTEIKVYTYNTKLEPIESNIKFRCFATSCDIGRTEIDRGESVLIADFPQCVNGHIVASAEGYKTKTYLVSSLEEESVILVLDKKYKLDLEIQGRSDFAIFSFTKNNETITVAYPEQKEVELTEGQYEIKIYVYSDSTINLKGGVSEKCVSVPKSGVLGIFGLSEEKCFSLEIPNQVVSKAVSGGGSQNYYITESELEDSSKLIIKSNNFKIPSKVEDLQENYNKISISDLDISFE